MNVKYYNKGIATFLFLFICLDILLIYKLFRLKNDNHELNHKNKEMSLNIVESYDYIDKTQLIINYGYNNLLNIITENNIALNYFPVTNVILAPEGVCESCFSKLLYTVRLTGNIENWYVISESNIHSIIGELWIENEFKIANWIHDRSIYHGGFLSSDLVVLKYSNQLNRMSYFLYNPELEMCNSFIILFLN